MDTLRPMDSIIVPEHLTGLELWTIYQYAGPEWHYKMWRAGWDLTEEEDFIHGYSQAS